MENIFIFSFANKENNTKNIFILNLSQIAFDKKKILIQNAIELKI